MAGREVLGQGVYVLSFAGDTAGIQSFSKSFSGLKTSLAGVAQGLQVVNTGTGKVSLNLKQATPRINTASKSLRNFSNEMFHASIAAGALSAAFIGVGAAITKVTFGFDRNMALIAAVTGATNEEFQKLSVNAREAGLQTEFGATRAAEGMLVLSRMGLNAAQSMEVLTPAMKLAQAQQQDLTSTTQLVVSQLKVFGKEMSEAETFANVLAATSSKTAADLEKLSLALSFAGPVAKATGRSFEEINTVLGIMFNAGIRASRAGTSLRFGLAALLGTTGKTEGALKKLNLTLKDVDPTSKSLNEIFVLLADRMKGVQNRAALLFDIFGKRAAPAFAAVTDRLIANRDEFKNLQDSITGTDEVQRQYAIQMDSLSGQILLLRSALEDLGIEFGQVLAPTLKLIVGATKAVVDWFRNLSPAAKETIVFIGQTAAIGTTLITVFTTMAFVLGNIAKLFIGVATGIGRFVTGQKAASAASIAAVGAQQQLGVAMQNNIGLVVKQTLVEAGLSKRRAQAITQYALESTAQEKNNIVRIKTIASLVAESTQKKGLTITNAGLLKSMINATVGQEAWNVAATQGVVKATIFSRALVGLSASIKGVWAAMGGWVGLIITGLLVAIPALVSWIIKLTGAQKANREENENNIETLNKFIKAMDNASNKVADVQKAIIAGTKSAGDLTKANKELEESQLKLALAAPGLVIGLNDENDMLEFQLERVEALRKAHRKLREEKLKEEIRKEVGREVTPIELQFREQIDVIRAISNVEDMKKKLQELEDRGSDNLRGIEEGLANFGKELGISTEKAAELVLALKEKEFAESAEVFEESSKKVKELSKSITPIAQEYRETITSAERLETALNGVNGMVVKQVQFTQLNSIALKLAKTELEKLEEAEEEAGEETERLAKNQDKGSKSARDYASQINSIINALERLKERMNVIRKDLQFRIQDIGAGEFESAMIRIDRSVLKTGSSIDKIVKSARDKVDKLRLIAKKSAKATAELVDAKALLGSVELFAEQSKIILGDWAIKSRELFEEEFAQKVIAGNLEMNEKIAKLQTDAVKVFDDSLKNRIKALKASQAKELGTIRLQIRKIKAEMKELEEIEGPLTFAQAKDLENLQNQLSKHFQELLALSEKHQQDLKGVNLAGLRESLDIQQRELEVVHKNDLVRLNNKRNNLKKELAFIKKNENSTVEQHRETLLRLREADQEYSDATLDMWLSIGKSINSVITSIGEIAAPEFAWIGELVNEVFIQILSYKLI